MVGDFHSLSKLINLGELSANIVEAPVSIIVVVFSYVNGVTTFQYKNPFIAETDKRRKYDYEISKTGSMKFVIRRSPKTSKV